MLQARPRYRIAAHVALVAFVAAAWALSRRGDLRTAPPSGERIGFTMKDVAPDVGIEFQHHSATIDPKAAVIAPHIVGMSAAVSICDADGDGVPDVYATSAADKTPNSLWIKGADGRYHDEAARAGLAQMNTSVGCSTASIWADVDNDGDEDMYLVKWGYPQFFRNDGNLQFHEVTAEAGLKQWRNANSACWIDYDRDGFLDLFVAGYFRDDLNLWDLKSTEIMQESFEFAANGGHKALYHNLGGLRFEEVAKQLGVDNTRWTLAVASADFNQDGWPDLYLANDYGPEILYINQQGKHFTAADDVGLNERSKSGMSVALGDVRNRGIVDVYVTNISKRGFLFQGNNLRLNDLGLSGRMRNVAEGDVADCGWAWGAQFGDFNNDGFQDLFVLNGFISASRDRDYWYDMGRVASGAGQVMTDMRNWAPIGDRSLSGYERSRVLLNDGHGELEDVAAAVGVDDLLDGRAVSLGDLFGDGAVDAVVANQNAKLLLYRTTPDPANEWIEFRLKGSARAAASTGTNRSAIGTSITLEWSNSLGEQKQTRVVDGGSGFASQNDKTLHFGLGRDVKVHRALIRWTSGRTQTLTSPALRTRIVVEEPAS